MKDQLVERGRKWQSLTGLHFKQFSGKKRLFGASTDEQVGFGLLR